MKLIDVLGRAALVALTSGAMVVAGCSSHVSGSTGAGGLQDETPWAATNWGIPRRAERRVVEAPAPTPAPAAKPAPRMTGCGNVRSTPAGYTWSGMAFPTGEAATSVLCVEKGLPAQVVLGQEFEYLIYVTNIGQADLNNVTVNDVTSAGWSIVSSTPTGRISGNNMSWDLGTMGPGDQELITVRAKATQAGTIDACASATYNSSVCVATQVVQPSLLVTKSAPAEVLACDQIPIKIVVTNNGTGPASNVQVTDNLPAGLTVNGQQVVTLDAGTLAAGQSREFTLMATAARTGRFENKATASGSPSLAAESTATVTVVKKPVLTLVQECSGEMFLGRESEVKLTVKNTGDAVSRGTNLQANLASGARFASATDGGVSSGTAVTWALGELAPGATRTVSYRYASDVSGTLRSTSTVAGNCAEPVSANCETVYKGIPAILVECIDVEDPDEVGTTDVYIIRVTNQGTAPGTGIKVVGEVPGQMSFESASGATTGTAAGRTVTFAPLATLAPRATAEWRVVVMCNEPGDARFQVRVTSDQFTNPIQETESTTIYQ